MEPCNETPSTSILSVLIGWWLVCILWIAEFLVEFILGLWSAQIGVFSVSLPSCLVSSPLPYFADHVLPA
jgi:hypothetical protein